MKFSTILALLAVSFVGENKAIKIRDAEEIKATPN